MTVEPIGDRVLVKVLDEETTTPAGIILPETAKEKPQHGIVVAVGKSLYEEELIPVEVGDRVMFAKFSGTEIKLEGEDHLILDSSDILARITD